MAAQKNTERAHTLVRPYDYRTDSEGVNFSPTSGVFFPDWKEIFVKLFGKRRNRIVLILCVFASTLSVGIFQSRQYFVDYNKDGRNWFDYRRRIKALELLTSDSSRIEWRPECHGSMLFALGKAYERIAVYYSGEKRIHLITNAKNAMERARSFAGENLSIRIELAKFYLDTDDLDTGIKLLEGHAVSVVDFKYLSLLYEKKRDYGMAISSLDRAIKINDSLDNLYNLYFLRGGLYEKIGEMEKANADYRLALENFPEKETFMAPLVGNYYPVEGQKEWKILTRERRDRLYDDLRRKYGQALERTSRGDKGR